MTINNFYRYYLQQLQQIYSLQEASVITEWVFENKASIRRLDILKLPDQILDDKKSAALTDALQQLLLHTPVQYVLGQTWFYNLKLKVNEQVLIPRPETEELVKWIIDEQLKQKEKFTILDIGTGSGCIAIVLKKNLPHALITAIDVSNGALSIAKENAFANDAAINFLSLDFLNEEVWKQLPAFDIIVSNPPYIPINEKDALDKNVTGFEPHTALFVPDNSPLLFYEKIALFATNHLTKNGKIYLETHEDFANQTAALFSKQFSSVLIKKDLPGKERMIKTTHFR